MHCLEWRKVLIGDNLSSHLSDAVITACSQNNIAFVCLYPSATHLLQPLDVAWFAPLKKVWRKTLEDWKRSPQGIRHKGSFPKEHFKKLLKTLLKCGLYPFNLNVVYEKLPSKNVMSPRKALDKPLLQQLQRTWENPLLVKMLRRTRKEPDQLLHLGNQSVILILSPAKVSLGLRTSQGQRQSLRKAILRKIMILMMNKYIRVGDFAMGKNNYSWSVKYYMGESIGKDSNGQILFIFLERNCGLLFKYRENIIWETANINMVKNVLAAPTVTHCGGKLDLKSSNKIIDCLRCLY